MLLKFVYINTLVLAGLSILYELLIAHTISTLAANTVVWYSLTIGVYMAFLGLGSMFYKKVFKGDTWVSLFKVEIALSFFGGVSVLCVHAGHMLFYYFMMNENVRTGIFAFFGISFITSATVGLLSGFELPLLLEAGNKVSRGKRVTNRVLAFDYIGALSGSLLFPLFLIPRFGTVHTGFIIASINLSVGILLVLTTLKEKRVFYLTASLPVGALFILSLTHIDKIDQYFMQKYYYYYMSRDIKDIFLPGADLPLVERERSPYQKIDIVPSPIRAIPMLMMEAYSDKYLEDPDFPSYMNLFIEGDFQVNSNMEEIYHEYFAHVPVILSRQIPQNILVLGAGDGILHRELLKYPGAKITHVELDRKMIDISKNNPVLRRMNKGSLENPRVKLVPGDAFQFLRRDRNHYDAIYMDFPNPVSYTLSKLYSKEFFQFLKRRLSRGGYVAINAAGIGYLKDVDEKGGQAIDEENTDWPIYYQTLKAAGFNTVVPYISNFETKNSRVEAVLEEIGILPSDSPGKKNEGKMTKKVREGIIAQLSLEQRDIMEHGFIFATTAENGVNKDYIDFGINTYVLNEERFNRAFEIPFPPSEGTDKVNSIMKPVFPNLPFTYIRLPF